MLIRVAAMFLCALALTGCPHGPRHIPVGHVPTNGDPEARNRFLEAQASFRRDGDGADDFAAIAEDYPDDPIAPWAHLYAGIAQVNAKDYAGAEKSLGEVLEAGNDKGLRLKAQLYLGLAKNYEGEHTAAVPLLAPAESVIETDAERGEWLAALAVALSAGDDPLAALPYYDRWYAAATPAERGYILARITELAAAVAPQPASAAFDKLDKHGPGAAILGYRVAADRDAANDPGGAKKARDQATPARKALGLPLAATASAVAPGGGEPGLVGAILPQGGKSSRVGELATEGLAVAAGAAGTGAGVITVDVRPAETAEDAAAAVDELAAGGVIAVIGPIDAALVDAASARANALHVPLLSLSPSAEQRTGGRWVFHLWHSPEQRARVLARRAAAAGVTTFALLAPDNGYGRVVSTAFVDEVKKLGGSIAVTQTYPAATKSFASIAKKIGHQWGGVFVADSADKLELIAPALAAAGQMAKPPGTKRATGGRPMVLLSTAEGLAPDYLVDAGRHSEGAMLAPGFYPDDKDPAIGEFIKRYVAGTGKPPGAIDAYAYDGAVAVAATHAAGRTDLASRLDKLDQPGITGSMRFDSDHRRADDGVIFTVVPGDGDTFEIHAAR